MTARLNFELNFQTQAKRLNDDSSMRIYFCGDFSGQPEQTSKKISSIDIDNFDEVMAKISPSILLKSGHRLTFNELDDFHPDNLFNTPLFSNLRRLKRELNNSETAMQAAEEIWQTYQLAPIENHTETEAKNIENSDDMFEHLLGQVAQIENNEAPKDINALDQYISTLLAPHIVADTKPEHQNLMVFIDSVLEELMNSILHSVAFQNLEAIWRSTYDLLFSEDYDEETQFFYLVNISKQQLFEDMKTDANFGTSLVTHALNTDEPVCNLIVANYSFSTNNDDRALLQHLGAIATQLHGNFLATADESLLNKTDDNWKNFRTTAEAAHIGLSYPRILLRIPYGKKHEEVDVFDFEEFRGTYQHKHLLWGNSAFAWARLLVRQYHGRQAMNNNEISNLPAFVYGEGNEQTLQACGEKFLSEQQLNQIVTQGVMPFISFHNRNSVRLFSTQTIAIES